MVFNEIFIVHTSLNTMFKEIANTMFNRSLKSCEIICAMNAQMTRLYQAAKKLKGVEGQTDVARMFDATPQTLNNWESRGISNEGLLKAQEVLGCNAIWIRDGVGEMMPGAASIVNADLSDVAKLVQLYGQSTENGRKLILSLASSTEKISNRSDIAANN